MAPAFSPLSVAASSACRLSRKDRRAEGTAGTWPQRPGPVLCRPVERIARPFVKVDAGSNQLAPVAPMRRPLVQGAAAVVSPPRKPPCPRPGPSAASRLIGTRLGAEERPPVPAPAPQHQRPARPAGNSRAANTVTADRHRTSTAVRPGRNSNNRRRSLHVLARRQRDDSQDRAAADLLLGFEFEACSCL